MRLSKITTRTGDDGTTGLADGTRLPKDHPRIITIGSVDELNSYLGGVAPCLHHDEHRLHSVQLRFPGLSQSAFGSVVRAMPRVEPGSRTNRDLATLGLGRRSFRFAMAEQPHHVAGQAITEEQQEQV